MRTAVRGILSGSWGGGIEDATLGGPQPSGLLSSPPSSPSPWVQVFLSWTQLGTWKSNFNHFSQGLIKNAAVCLQQEETFASEVVKRALCLEWMHHHSSRAWYLPVHCLFSNMSLRTALTNKPAPVCFYFWACLKAWGCILTCPQVHTYGYHMHTQTRSQPFLLLFPF